MENNNLENTTNTVITNEPKKKNKGTKVIIIFLLLVILGLGGYIAFDKVLKEKICGTEKECPKCEKCTKCKETSVTNNDKDNDTKDNKKTADEIYAEYLENLKSNISKTYNGNELNKLSDDELAKIKDVYKYGFMNVNNLADSGNCVTEGSEGLRVCVHIDENNNLKLNLYETDSNDLNDVKELKEFKNVDTNVLQIYMVNSGQEQPGIYYMKKDGSIYKVDNSIYSGELKKIGLSNLKNIIYIIDSSFGTVSGWSEPIFVDIEGNLFRVDENNKVIQLNK